MFDTNKIRINAREELIKLISEFADDCANTYNKNTEDYNRLQKITNSLKVHSNSSLHIILLSQFSSLLSFPFVVLRLTPHLENGSSCF